MRLAMISFTQIYTPTNAECNKLRAAMVFNPSQDSADIIDIDGELHTHRQYLVDMDLMPAIPLQVHKFISAALPGLDTDTASRGIVINQKVEVAVPGLGLLLIDEVKVVTDECTEELQRELLDGWRILAICPQPNQRRPDYVLGRVRKDHE